MMFYGSLTTRRKGNLQVPVCTVHSPFNLTIHRTDYSRYGGVWVVGCGLWVVGTNHITATRFLRHCSGSTLDAGLPYGQCKMVHLYFNGVRRINSVLRDEFRNMVV
jgi:hypothetical protein